MYIGLLLSTLSGMSTTTNTFEENAAWIARLHAGEKTVFEELHQRYARELLAFLASRCPASLTPEDLGQSVWMKLWNKRLDFTEGDFRPWMYRIAKNHLIDQYRRKVPERLAEDVDLASPELDEEDDRLDALRECLEQVEGTFIEMVRGKTQGISTEQLATMYQVNSKTVATRIHRGKQLLRECVERKIT